MSEKNEVGEKREKKHTMKPGQQQQQTVHKLICLMEKKQEQKRGSD